MKEKYIVKFYQRFDKKLYSEMAGYIAENQRSYDCFVMTRLILSAKLHDTYEDAVKTISWCLNKRIDGEIIFKVEKIYLA